MQLYQHQKNAIRNGIIKKKYAIYHEQGLGKTFTAIAIAKWAIVKGDILSVDVICPAFLKINWANEIYKFDANLVKYFKIHSYEKFTKLPEIVRKQIKFIIVDEAHYIKNRRTFRTNAVVNTAMRAQRVLLLTGTPVGNAGILDLYTHLVCLNHCHEFAKYSRFAKNFIRVVMVNNKFPVKHSKNESQFLEIIGEYSERKTKNECLDLPDKVYIEIPAQGEKVPKNVHIQYKLMAQEGFDFFTKDKVHEFKGHEKKLLVLLDLLETLGSSQVVIFCAFKKSVEFLAEKITKKLRIKCGVFYSELSEQKRNIVIENFRQDNFQCLIATMQSLNTGVTLVNCNQVIYYSRSFSRIERSQSEDRFHRIGQTNKVTYYDVISSGFDRHAFDLIKSRKSFDEIKNELENYEG